MFVCNLAYRHDNGEVEGFTATRFTNARTARAACIECIANKCFLINRKFDAGKVIYSPDGLTPEELALVKADWKL